MDEIFKMSRIEAIQQLQEKISGESSSFTVLNCLSIERLEVFRDKLILIYNSVREDQQFSADTIHKREELKTGDKVKITNGNYAVRVDKFEEYNSIGLCKDVFEVIKPEINDEFIITKFREIPIHNIFIRNVKTNEIYLHSAAFVRKVRANTKLIKALEKSILQWQLMIDTDKSKYDCYKFLDGKNEINSSTNNVFNCFLCDEFYRLNDCIDCLTWNNTIVHIQCLFSNSCFYLWDQDNTKENTQKVLDYLKSELESLTKGEEKAAIKKTKSPEQSKGDLITHNRVAELAAHYKGLYNITGGIS